MGCSSSRWPSSRRRATPSQARLKKAGSGRGRRTGQGAAEAFRPRVGGQPALLGSHRKAFDRLIDAGERFRKAQASQLAGKSADLRGPLEARRAALSELTRLAAGVLRHAGHNATPDLMRRVTTTLEALSTYGAHPDAPPAGRLTDDVEPPGFEALAALVPRVGRRTGRRRAKPRDPVPAQDARAARRPQEDQPGRGGAPRRRGRKAQIAAASAAMQEAERRCARRRKRRSRPRRS